MATWFNSKQLAFLLARFFGWPVDITGGWQVIGFSNIFISLFGIIGGIISSKIILRQNDYYLNKILKRFFVFRSLLMSEEMYVNGICHWWKN